MKPPRYRLREYVVESLLPQTQGSPFLELGYGSGQMLATLAANGLQGEGFDFSDEARKEAGRLLQQEGITSVRLLDAMPASGQYGLIMFFEVIGYWQDVQSEFNKIKPLLAPNGCIIFSFTNARNAGKAEEKTGHMRCFTRREVEALLHQADLEPVRIINYGFPLTNAMRPLLHLYHALKPAKSGDLEATKQSGVRDTKPSLLSKLLVFAWQPFCWLQMLFKNSDLGTGYVVVARLAK